MTQISMKYSYAKKVAKKFKGPQNYLKTNGFSRSTKHHLREIKYCWPLMIRTLPPPHLLNVLI